MYLGYSQAPGKGEDASPPPEVDIPLDDLGRDLLRRGLSSKARGLYATVILSILDRLAPVPADDRKAARMLGYDVRAYRHDLAECIEAGSLVRLPSGEISSPIIARCRPARPRSADRIKRAAIPSATRDAVLAKTSGRCAYCAVALITDPGHPNSFEPDHVLPVVRGGSDDIANLIPSCMSCNRKKRDKTALTFTGGTDAS